MRRTLLSLTVVACLCVPAVAGVARVRDAQRSTAELTEGASLLERPLSQAAELGDLPTSDARAKLHSARDGAADEQQSRRARALGQVCDAIEALRRGEHSTAAQSADGAIRLAPDEPIALLVHAAAAAGRGDRGAAERSLDRVTRNRNAPPSLRERAAFMRAEWMLDAGRSHEALDLLEALDRDRPRGGSVLNLLGLARSAVGDRVGALRAFEQAIETHPHKEVPLLNLARAYREQGQLDRARSTLERALGHSQDYADAWVAYGVVLADLHAPNARHVLVRAAQLAPNDATPLAAQGALDLAENHYEDAAESFRKALERDPDHAIARTNLGITLAHLGRNDLALRAFEQATQRAPHVGEAWNGLGSMRLASGDASGAVAALRQAMTLLPDDANPAINLGRALEALQQWDAASRAYREALRRQPMHQGAVDRLLAITRPEERAHERARLGLASEARHNGRAGRTLASRR